MSIFAATLIVDSLAINIQSHKFLRLPIVGIASIFLIIKFKLEELVTIKREKSFPKIRNEEIGLTRIVSPGLTSFIFLTFLSLVYVWTNAWPESFIGALLASAPLLILQILLPDLPFLKNLKNLTRSVWLESIVVAALVAMIYWGIEWLPLGVAERSKTFIILGVLPILGHAIYALLLASKERQDDISGGESIEAA